MKTFTEYVRLRLESNLWEDMDRRTFLTGAIGAGLGAAMSRTGAEAKTESREDKIIAIWQNPPKNGQISDAVFRLQNCEPDALVRWYNQIKNETGTDVTTRMMKDLLELEVVYRIDNSFQLPHRFSNVRLRNVDKGNREQGQLKLIGKDKNGLQVEVNKTDLKGLIQQAIK